MTSSVDYFVVFATDRPGMATERETIRPKHRAWLRDIASHGVRVRMGGPTLEFPSDTMNGTLLVVQAPCLDDVMRFIEADPYVQAGLFERVEVRPFNWTLGHPDAGV